MQKSHFLSLDAAFGEHPTISKEVPSDPLRKKIKRKKLAPPEKWKPRPKRREKAIRIYSEIE
jgi:hypothetical protein